ncbi:hypothetical protein [Leifsonia sp. A12D58]|uniref:hypothetical protein n=1 Tax=Leifsonia sp. A12D58 TaxID=3397674 RepID=UPI0039E14B2E
MATNCGSPIEELDREELRRLAFGRTATPAEELRARAAQYRLHELDSAADDQAVGLATAAAHVSTSTDSDATAAEERPAGVPESRRTRRWMILVAAIALIIMGAAVRAMVGGSGAGTPLSTSSSAASPLASQTSKQDDAPVPATSNPVPGDLVAAERWFTTPQQPSDVLVENFGMLDLSTTRLARQTAGVDPWNVFVAKDQNGLLCVVVSDPEQTSPFASCTSTSNFAASGLTLIVNDRYAYWNGVDIATAPSRLTTG